jgi:putative ABC transport system permease protein
VAFMHDVRFAIRLLAKNRGFTLVAVMALALGMAVNSTFFAIVNAITLGGPIDDPAGLVHVGTRGASGAPAGMSYADFDDVSRAVRTMSGMAAYMNTLGALADEDRAAERVTGAYVTTGAWPILREQPILGRPLLPEDDRTGAAPVVLISETLWRTRYAADPSLIGLDIRINGVPVTVVGILRDGFRFPNDALFWMPLASGPDIRSQPRGMRNLGVFARLTDGMSIAQAETELNGIMSRLAASYSESNRGITATVVPINRQFTPPLNQPAWIAFIVAGALVLIIACANVANLLLARSLERSGEMAVRLSLGASRGRIVRQLLAESAALAVLGAATGLALSVAGMRAYESMIPEGVMPSFMSPTIDGRVLTVLAAVTCGTVLLFGFVPALFSSRLNPGRLLNDRGTAGGGGRSARRWTTVFLTAEFALTFVFIAGLVLDLRTFVEASQQERVMNPTDLMTASVTLPAERYATPDSRYLLLERLTSSLEASGATAASMASVLPFAIGAPRKIDVEGRPRVADAQLPDVRLVAVAPRYFEAIGTAPRIGREFTARDGTPGEAAAIVNERLVAMLFPDGQAIGRRVRLPVDGASTAADWMTIVGVAPTIQQGPGAEPTPVVYVPLRATAPATVALLVRGSSGSPLASLLREQVRALDRDLPLARLTSMEQALIDAGWNARLSSALFRSIAVIGLMLALVGLYGVTAYAVTQRTRELGVRLALGAQGRQLAWLLMRRVLLQLAIASGIGVLLTVAWDRAFSVGSSRMADPLVLLSAVVAIASVGSLAAIVPVRRAARIDPVASLRAE